MTFNPNCPHQEGWYLCDTPKHPTHWLMWCCAARCGYCQEKHPFTGISYPRKDGTLPKLRSSQPKEEG